MPRYRRKPNPENPTIADADSTTFPTRPYYDYTRDRATPTDMDRINEVYAEDWIGPTDDDRDECVEDNERNAQLIHEVASDDSSDEIEFIVTRNNVIRRTKKKRGWLKRHCFRWFKRYCSNWFFTWCMIAMISILCYSMILFKILYVVQEPEAGNNDMNLMMVPRENWENNKAPDTTSSEAFAAERVVVTQTETPMCDTVLNCTGVIKEIKRKQRSLMYSFLLGSDGHVYEGLGWQEPSPLYNEVPTMVVAFIGNYTTVEPSKIQLVQLQKLLDVSLNMKYLTKSYTIVGRKDSVTPTKLFGCLESFKNWDKKNSDADDQSKKTEKLPSVLVNV